MGYGVGVYVLVWVNSFVIRVLNLSKRRHYSEKIAIEYLITMIW